MKTFVRVSVPMFSTAMHVPWGMNTVTPVPAVKNLVPSWTRAVSRVTNRISSSWR
jgi:hypothetical protein